MTIAATLAIFVGIPLAVALVVTGLVFAAGGRDTPRYRPGRPFTFTPVWYLAEAPPGAAGDDGDHRPDTKALPASGAGTGTPVVRLDSGGARGTW